MQLLTRKPSQIIVCFTGHYKIYKNLEVTQELIACEEVHLDMQTHSHTLRSRGSYVGHEPVGAAAGPRVHPAQAQPGSEASL